MQGEGHFIALLRKKAPWEDHAGSTGRGAAVGAPGRSGTAGKRKLPEELEEFLGSLRLELNRRRLEIREERVYYMPEGMPELRGIRFLRSGLLLGELKKNRFEPGQALAMYLKKEDYGNILDLSAEDERVIRYLKGETLDVEDLVSPSEKGWYLVCVDGYPLGFGKLASQVLKNKYLPGWRWMS